jgi:phage-related minor tail protein
MSEQWFGKGGRELNSLEEALAVVTSQKLAVQAGIAAMYEIAAVATRRADTCLAVFGQGHVSVARAKDVVRQANGMADLYDEVLSTLDDELTDSIRACLEENP